jgi:hypothetical protein
VSNNTIESWMQQALVRAVRDILAGREPEPLSRPPTVALEPAEYAGALGRLAYRRRPLVSDSGGDGKLWLTWRGVRYRMFRDDPRSFYVPGLDLIVAFERDGSGSRTESACRPTWGVETGTRAPVAAGPAPG